MIEAGSGVFTERQISDTVEPPQVFVRVFQAPAGMPWEQGRAARLEARHGSPLPIADVMHQVKRLGAWSLGQPGRYAYGMLPPGLFQQLRDGIIARQKARAGRVVPR